MTEHRL